MRSRQQDYAKRLKRAKFETEIFRFIGYIGLGIAVAFAVTGSWRQGELAALLLCALCQIGVLRAKVDLMGAVVADLMERRH